MATIGQHLEDINPNGWQITDTYVGEDFVSLQIGFYDPSFSLVELGEFDLTNTKDGIVIDNTIMDPVTDWNLLWKNLINRCDTLNERNAEVHV